MLTELSDGNKIMQLVYWYARNEDNILAIVHIVHTSNYNILHNNGN